MLLDKRWTKASNDVYTLHEEGTLRAHLQLFGTSGKDGRWEWEAYKISGNLYDRGVTTRAGTADDAAVAAQDALTEINFYIQEWYYCLSDIPSDIK